MLQNSQKSASGAQGGGGVGVDEEGDDQEDPSSSSSHGQVKDEELANFRAQWCKELESSQVAVPAPAPPVAVIVSQDEAKDGDEEKARLLFLKGVEHEQKGKLYEAIQFYRRAVQLVPDIEFRLFESTNQRHGAETAEEEEETTAIVDDEELEDNNEDDEFDTSQTELFPHLQRILSKTFCVCQPKVPQKTPHISSLPVEIILYILRWVVSSDLDMRSLEMASLVCRGFYVCSRDPEIWRLACIRVWGVNCGGLSEYKSWREMFTSRPRIQFNGCYISKTTYVRHGENSFQDQFYRPWHFVEYFRYLRFFPEGLVLMLTTTEEPVSCLGLLKTRQVRNPSVLVGHYRLSGDGVSLTVQKQESFSLQKFRTRKNNNTPEQTFHLEFDIVSRQSQSSNHRQLRWKCYSVFTKYHNGHEMTSAFEVASSKYPPLWFSRVKSYTAEADYPLM